MRLAIPLEVCPGSLPPCFLVFGFPAQRSALGHHPRIRQMPLKQIFCENKESEKKNTQHAVTGNGSNDEEDAHALLQQLHSSPGGGVCLGAAPVIAQLDPQGLHTLQLPKF